VIEEKNGRVGLLNYREAVSYTFEISHEFEASKNLSFIAVKRNKV